MWASCRSPVLLKFYWVADQLEKLSSLPQEMNNQQVQPHVPVQMWTPRSTVVGQRWSTFGTPDDLGIKLPEESFAIS